MVIAAVFPGQGSQSIGMLAELATEFPMVMETFAEASNLLDRDLWQIAQEGSEAVLNDTENTQPIMLAAGIAVWRVWLAQGGCQPVAMAGHSLGEYSALVASGALAFEDAVKLVQQRASLMKQAVPAGEGAMAAILGLDDQTVIDLCKSASAVGGLVEAVNFNSPGQVVIAGNSPTVDYAIELAKEAGAKRAIKLAVSVPSHCALMRSAAEPLAATLRETDLLTPNLPVLHNINAENYDQVDHIRDALAQQLYYPVRWVDTVQRLATDFQVDTVLEFGPGKVLFGLNRRINKAMTPLCISDRKSLDKALTFCAA
ncbi:MAG TPA: [acyl-carrier-protein] S-malonyltransferase [Thiothrix sp.]|nr:[acyl-carrier-protein] S-malonyltransferase [Thiothrix sp.]